MQRSDRYRAAGRAAGLAITMAVVPADLLAAGSQAPASPLAPGTVELDTPDFRLRLVRDSQTVAALEPKRAAGFDFTPGDRLAARLRDGSYHLGDLTLRFRQGDAGAWKRVSTAVARRPVTPLPVAGSVLSAADLAPTLPAGVPLRVVRSWSVETGRLVLRFALTNTTGAPVQIGGLGIPLVFNNDLTGRTLGEAHEACSFSDPYVGLDAGYVQVTRLSGQGPVLVVVGDGATPLEAYSPLLDDPAERTQTFEGHHEWLVHSRAYAETDWKGVAPWNRPSAATLAPGETRVVGLRFLVASGIRSVEGTLAEEGRPVAIGVPGYVLPMDLEGRLFVKSRGRVAAVEVEPAGSIDVAEGPGSPGGWASWTLRGRSWGRARLDLSYEDGTRQSIHYRITKPAQEAVADLGRFLTTRQWFDDPRDPFRRGPSVMSYDRELDRIVTQDSRVWIAGLGDEAGSGSWLAAAVKQLVRPERGEIGRLQRFVDEVLWGRLQVARGPKAYGVRKSLFHYEPAAHPPGFYDGALDWKSWTSWDRKKAERVDRSYDYPHAVALYWTFYRLARNHVGLVTNHPWEWYLGHAAATTLAMTRLAPEHARFGQMEGSVFLELLRDLKRERWAKEAGSVQEAMRRREKRWSEEAYPFASEMPWDSTGQEEVYAFSKYFGHEEKARVTLDAILGYTPTVPHWGYNGNARRYWDFLYGGKLRRVERQIHHYGSALNALPVLAAYRESPDDLHLLRVGFGGVMGPLTNIDREGFASAAFHSWPDTLAFDSYSGDYGPGLVGHALGTATCVVRDAALGWLAFGGNLAVENGTVAVTPLDSARSRVYLAPLGLWLTLDAGRFARVELDEAAGTVRVFLEPAGPFTPVARLRVEQPARLAGVGAIGPRPGLAVERGAFVVPLSSGPTPVELGPSPVRRDGPARRAGPRVSARPGR